MKRISVIIPSYNSKETIADCLRSVSAQTVRCGFEIILVDSSDDGTEEMVRWRFPEVHVVHLPEKTIPSKARNVGAQHATGEILAFTDSDCVPGQDWLQVILENVESGHEVVGGSVINGRPGRLISRAEYYIEFREFSENSAKREVRFLPSCNFAIRKETFARVGGFPEVRASEDTFLAHSLAEHGVKIVFDPAAKVVHLNRYRWGPFLRNQFILGKYAAVVRRILPMPGAFFVRVPYAFPVLPWVRTLRTLQFIFQNAPRHALG
ncbi:MAG: glycosyltransferase, partial [Calditrichaeota bacterium]